MSKSKNKRIKTILVLAVLIFGAVIFLYPLLWMLASSFRSLEEIAVKGMNLIPEKMTLKYYQKALTSFSFFTYFKNSLIVSGISIVATVISNSMIGYAFARFKVRGSNFLFMLVLATMLLPGEVMQIPRFIMFKNFGMLDTLYPLFITKFLEVHSISFYSGNFIPDCPAAWRKRPGWTDAAILVSGRKFSSRFPFRSVPLSESWNLWDLGIALMIR